MMHAYRTYFPLLGVSFALTCCFGCSGDSESDPSPTPDGGSAVDSGQDVDASTGDGAVDDTSTGDGGSQESGWPDVGEEDGAQQDATPQDASEDSDGAAAAFCLECVELRVGRPLVARGPFGDELDTGFSAIPLGTGGWRGFSANSSTYAIDGDDPWSMGGPRTLVLSPGLSGSDSECGQWINDVKPTASGHQAFVHWERSCDYANGQTHKSMAYATSQDEGHSWNVQGMILSGTDAPTAGAHTGEGDCRVVDGADGHFYAYCLRTSDYQTIVARAPTSNPGPGMWQKYYQGAWNEPGLGGEADALGAMGPSASRWTSQDQMMAWMPDKWFGGVKLSFASDRVHFSTLPEPVLALDDVNWLRPASSELVAYISVLNPADGSRQVDGEFLLAYIYLQPGEDFSQRYLVFRSVVISHGSSVASPQVGVALARWYSDSDADRWSTTAPVPGNFDSYSFEDVQGYLMTQEHPTLASAKLEDCVSDWPGHPDHMLAGDGTCETAGYTRLRTAGWVFTNQQPGTKALYRCFDDVQQTHFASDAADCEGLGNQEFLLGYVLAQ